MGLFKLNETTFEQYDSTIKTYLTKTLGAVGQQYSHTQIFNIVFDGIKSIMQNAMFYIEDALTEQNVETAFRKSSLYSLAKISGYDAYYGSAATGLLNCIVSTNNGLNNSSNNFVYIKNYTKIVNETTGQSYLVYLPNDYYIIDLSKPLNINQFKVVQGVHKTAGYVATGEPLETLHLNTVGLYDKDYIEVRVDGELYTQAASLYDMYETDKAYVLSTGYNNEVDIIFGDNIHGRQLKEGQTITIKYIIHNGASGNLNITDNAVFKFSDPLYDSAGNQLSNTSFLKLTPLTSITGGQEADTIYNIKNMIGYNSRSLVLATEQNYTLFLKRFSFVGNSKVWIDNNSLIVNAVCTKNLDDKIKDFTTYFSAVDNNDILLSDYQKSIIKDTLNKSNKTFAGISFNFIDPIIYKYGIIIYLKVNNTYNKTILNTTISKLIADYFINLKPNTSFVSKSELIKHILDNVSYIESIDLTFISDMNERANKNGYYYKYDKVNTNASWKYEYTKHVYTKDLNLGLDDFGNISIEDKFGLPWISNNVTYAYSYDENNNDSYVLDNAINFIYM
jgi:hypothetical protein